jgi:hypothetical protein
MSFGADWDTFGRLVMAVGLMALLAYLAPGILSLSPAWARTLQLATFVLIGAALFLAIAASIIWFLS